MGSLSTSTKDDTEILRRQAPVAYFLIIASASILLVSTLLGFSLIDRPLLFACIAFTLGLVFAIGLLLISIASCISEEILYLAVETQQEAGSLGGDLSDAVRTLDDLLGFYQRTLEHRFMSSIFLHLFGANRVLLRARSRISDPAMGSSLESIHKAGEDLARFCEFLHEGRYGRFYAHAKRFINPDPERTAEAEKAMREFNIATKELEEHPSFATAHTACVHSRRAGAMLHCVWPEYSQQHKDDPHQTQQLRDDLQRVLKKMTDLLEDVPESQSTLLRKYTVSLQRRIEALEALRRNDRPSVWRVLHTALAKA